jgi:phosphatidylglycerol---prolipoprotein diacylglyceryl transferase
MYAHAFLLSAAGTTAVHATDAMAVPYFHLGSLDIGPVPIQAFGVIVALGVLIGAALLRRYAEWHGVSDDHIRGLTGWIAATGFLGAHIFDVIAYQWPELERDPLLLLKLWKGISSYGGFLGGAMGFFFYTWWKRLDMRLQADIGIVGLLPAFSIGRIACTVVSDHVGRAVDPNAWYAALAMDYPHKEVVRLGLNHLTRIKTDVVPAWNLGMIELLYLIPVNALILWLAFRKKRPPAGFLIVLTGVLYAPVRFFLDYLRPESSDPRYVGLTFAQWCSLLAFGAAVYVALRILKNGKPADVFAETAGEMQRKLASVLKEDLPKVPEAKAKPKGKTDAELAEEKRVKALEEEKAAERKKKEDAEEIAAAERRKKQDEAMAAKTAAEQAAKDEAAKTAAEKAAKDEAAKKAAGDKKDDEK